MLKNIIQTKNQTLWILTLSGAVIALIINLIQQGRVNDDFVLYHEVARLFLDGQWQAGMKLYNWPLYPALLALISKSGMDIHAAAQVLNIGLFSLTTYSFLALIEEVGGTRQEMIFGALLLFASPYIVGDILPMLIRDQGFWAFFLTGLLFLLKYIRTNQLIYALSWQIAMLIAVLFRIEAITYLLLLPLGVLFLHKPRSWQILLKAVSLSLVLATALILILAVHPDLHLRDMGRLDEVVNIFHHNYLQMTEVLVSKSELMAKHVLGNFLDDYSLIGVIMTLVSILMIKAASAPGWIGTILAACACRNPSLPINHDAQRMIVWTMVLALINASMIVLSTFVLSGRYLISFALMILLFASFSLAELAREFSSGNRFKRGVFLVVLVALSLYLIKNILPKSAMHNYEQQAVSWLKTENTEHKPVFYVSPRTRYYAGEPYQGRGYNYWEFTSTAIKNHSIENYEYLLINFDNKYRERESILRNALVNYSLIKEFNGVKDKNKVMIFRKNHD